MKLICLKAAILFVYWAFYATNVKNSMKINRILFPETDISDGKLRLLIIALSTPDTIRQELVYNYSHRYINQHTRHRVIFITEPGKNINNFPIIKPHEDLMRLAWYNGSKNADKERGAKRISAAKYFIENTSYDYLWISADDVYYDVEAIDPMLENFKKKYNTEKDIIFKGHVADYGSLVWFQGGCGWILSRAGARKLLTVGYQWVKDLKWPDDMASHYLRNMMKLTVQETATHYMFGHYFKYNVSLGFWKNVATCPKNLPPYRPIPNTIFPLKDLVAIHNWPNNNNVAQRIMTSIIDAKKHDQSLLMYFDYHLLYICRRNTSL